MKLSRGSSRKHSRGEKGEVRIKLMELKTTFNVKSDHFSLFILLFKVQDELEAVKTLAVLEPRFRNVSFSTD